MRLIMNAMGIKIKQLQEIVLEESESTLKLSLSVDQKFAHMSQAIGNKPTDLDNSINSVSL